MNDDSMWTCPDCAFTFAAEHENTDGSGYSCPACAEFALTVERDALQATIQVLREALEAIAEPDILLDANEDVFDDLASRRMQSQAQAALKRLAGGNRRQCRARYPFNPDEDERDALRSVVRLWHDCFVKTGSSPFINLPGTDMAQWDDTDWTDSGWTSAEAAAIRAALDSEPGDGGAR